MRKTLFIKLVKGTFLIFLLGFLLIQSFAFLNISYGSHWSDPDDEDSHWQDSGDDSSDSHWSDDSDSSDSYWNDDSDDSNDSHWSDDDNDSSDSHWSDGEDDSSGSHWSDDDDDSNGSHWSDSGNGDDCTSYYNKKCYNDDVYWYDSCGNREEKSKECGESDWGTQYRCSDGYIQKNWLEKGCSAGACYEKSVWKNDEYCGSDSWTSNYRCSGDWVQREKHKEGCAYTSCYDYYAWENYEDCGNYGDSCEDGRCTSEPSDCDCSSWGSWQDEGCGLGNCSDDQMYQRRTRDCDPNNCDDEEETRCVYDSECDYDECTDQCSYSGDRRCYSGTRYQTCGNYDSDSCLEWSSSYSCEGSNSCGYGKCDNDERPDWYCSGGDCEYDCDYDSDCGGEEHDYLSCYNNDVYWYDSDGYRQDKYKECGDDYCGSWGSNYCSGGDVYKKRTCYDKGCSSGACYSNSYTESKKVEDCGYDETCRNGRCVYDDCECSSGPCCDGCYYKSSSHICDTETDKDYGCPWGESCGSDVGVKTRSKFRYCSGNSSSCTGRWGSWSSWSSWKVTDYCSSNEVCEEGKSSCQYESDCAKTGYIIHYQKSCYNNDLYWYDSNGKRQDIYRDCSDANSCTIDGCSGSACYNNLVCDGSTCSIRSEDYNLSCYYCGDGKCDRGENDKSCPEDCRLNGLEVAIFGKESTEPAEWKEELEIKLGEEFEILLIVTNGGEEVLEDVIVEVDIPEEITYLDEVILEDVDISEDIRNGIDIGDLSSLAMKKITFKVRLTSNKSLVARQSEVTLTGSVSTDHSYFSDDLVIEIDKSGKVVAAISGAFDSFGWLTLKIIIIILVLMAVLSFAYFVMKKVLFS